MDDKPLNIGKLKFSEETSKYKYILGPKDISNTKNCVYEIDKDPIGRGAFAVVYKGIDCLTGNTVAIKKISLTQDKIRKNIQHYKKLQLEIDNTVKLYHPNILKYYKGFKTDNNFYMITEYCDSGTLVDVIESLKLIKKPEDKELKTKIILVQLKDGLNYLLENHILHRDIKPANILFTREDDELLLKIADFGFSKSVDTKFQEEQQIDMKMSFCGSPLYMAPEILLTGKSSLKSDLWSFGIIMFEMLYGHNPYNTATTIEMLKTKMTNENIFSDDKFEKIYSTDCIKLLKSLLICDFIKRLEWKNFFKSQWFKETRKMIVEEDNLPFEMELLDSMQDEKKLSDDSADSLIKNKQFIVPKSKSPRLYNSTPGNKNISFDFSEDYIVVDKEKLNSSNNEMYQSYGSSYIRIITGISSFLLPKSY